MSSSTGKQTLGTIAVAVISGVLTNAVWEMPWAHWSQTTPGRWISGLALGAAVAVLLFFMSDSLSDRADTLQDRNRPGAARAVLGLMALNGLFLGLGGLLAVRYVITR
ncbi:hypothetical protein OG788_07870 [Streptomyces sp. NBC_00647]|uniref:hypothetical protein n=1 Tax=Streptomyces sp. NBC_00647 TaxID=2975796 RepID=UPI003251A16E